MQTKCAFALSLLVVALTLPCRAQQPASDQEKNKAVARAFFEEVLGQGKLEKYSDFHTVDFVGHGYQHDFNLADDLAAAREERAAFPDLQFRVNHMVAEGDMVAVDWTAWGTNTQPGMGLPATGKPARVPGMTIFRFKDGKISEEWGVWCVLSVQKQLGLLCTGPEPKFPSPAPTHP